MSLLHGHRPLHRQASPRCEGNEGSEDAACVDAVFQTVELLHGSGSPDPGGPGRPDRERVRLPLIPAKPAEGGATLEKRRREAQRAVEGNHYHTVANPAKGEKPGERGGRTGEAHGPPAGQDVTSTAAREEERRRFIPAAVANCSSQCRTP